MTAPTAIQQLVERFSRQLTSYKQAVYNEEQLRIEFLNPFFAELGWDVNNTQGYAEAYKEVIHEDALKISGVTKAPDYAFRVGGTRKFFLEAKKPSVNIKDDIHPAYQLRRYAWSAKLPLSILSDFEEFAVYDCRIKPDKMDAASTARVLYLRYTDYVDRWAEIAGIFAKEAILKGSFDQYAESHKAKRGTAEVDVAFLAEIERWRELLARNIALRNQSLSQRELNFAVQQTIDRIIFLRICEDRGIEPYGELMGLQNGTQIYARLVQKFRQADGRYNSGLFHFEDERGQTGSPDLLTPTLAIDDKVLKDILKNLYYPDSPYEFSVLPADILGQVYERFLGKVIRLTAGHQAKIEEKPEVRKAGGVFYTPTYIVDYIVAHTVGKLVEGKRPGPRGGVSDVRILDMACGSGSFLIGAYQFLLDWHQQQYLADGPEKWARKQNPQLYQTQRGDWQLTLDERKRILLNNIYGVDIDAQAVEVTKLSLLLKLLEGEDRQTLAPQLELFAERILPDIDRNIRCGNSLVGPEFFDGQMSLLSEDEMRRVNLLDWNQAFPDIMSNGGFDAIIGNPPYIRIQVMKEWAPLEVDYYHQRYQSAGQGNYDIYVVFVEKGLQLLNERGRLGFILPHKFFNARYGQPIRRIVSSGRHLSSIVHFGHHQVFDGATTYTCLLFMSKSTQLEVQFERVTSLAEWRYAAHDSAENDDRNRFVVLASQINAAEWNFLAGSRASLFERLSSKFPKLDDVADIFVGLQTSADDIFIMELVNETTDAYVLHSVALSKDWTFEKHLLHPLISGTDVRRYASLPRRQYILFPYDVNKGRASLIRFEYIKNHWPQTAEYLLANRTKLEQRERGRFRDSEWYRFGRNQNLGIQDTVKICVPRLVSKLQSTIDLDSSFYLDNVDVGGVTFKSAFQLHDIKYLLGLLNSKLLAWYFPQVSAPFRGGWWSANRQFLGRLPVRIIDFNDPQDALTHSRIVSQVSSILDLYARLANSKSPVDRQFIITQLSSADRQIDRLVYELYKLSDEEIEIVEGD